MSKKELSIKKSYYKLDKKDLEKIDNIINRYFLDLLNNISSKNLNVFELSTYAIVIGEAFPLFLDKDKWREVSYVVMDLLRKEITNPTYQKTLALFGGYSEVGLAAYVLNKNTGNYGKFLSTINSIILQSLEQLIETCNKNSKELRMQHYDAITGLSGIGYYLLLFEIQNENKKLYHQLLEYLINLTHYDLVEGNLVPNWYIKSANQYREDEKIDFPKGNFNFGLAHGIAGPMVTLSRAYNKNVILPNHKEAIESVIKEYKKYMIIDENHIAFWPTQLKFEDYVNNNANDLFRPRKASWCYGNIGISRALYIGAKTIGDIDTMNLAFRNIEKIASMNIDQYLLDTPIICHGYAGLLSILNVTYNETKNRIIKDGVYKIFKIILDSYDEESKYGFKNKEIIYDRGIISENISEDNSLLEGTSGIVLALISIIKEKTYFEEQLLII